MPTICDCIKTIDSDSVCSMLFTLLRQSELQSYVDRSPQLNLQQKEVKSPFILRTVWSPSKNSSYILSLSHVLPMSFIVKNFNLKKKFNFSLLQSAAF